MTKERTVIDLFCGAGGLSEGFRQAGYHVLAGNDFDEAAGETYAATHREARFLPGPIQNYTPKDFMRAAGLRAGELDCLAGGPPCQGFSVYNHQRGLHDQRSSLYREYLRLVDGLNPRWVVFENVTGMSSAGGGGAMRAMAAGLRKLGYTGEWKVLKAEEYGVPQERRRLVFIGTRLQAPVLFPELTHGEGLLPFVTVRDAISDLPSLLNGEDKGVMKFRRKPQSDYQIMLRGDEVEIYNHSAPQLGDINMRRMKHIPEGGSWRDVPIALLPAGMRRARRCDHTKRYGRLRWNGLASTILTKCDLHWGAYIHPEQNRVLTVREAARFQSFPDWFHFSGSRTEQYVQVGNAVPPLLGRQIAETLIEAETSDFRLVA